MGAMAMVIVFASVSNIADSSSVLIVGADGTTGDEIGFESETEGLVPCKTKLAAS